jgi:hypothetical protein
MKRMASGIWPQAVPAAKTVAEIVPRVFIYGPFQQDVRQIFGGFEHSPPKLRRGAAEPARSVTIHPTGNEPLKLRGSWSRRRAPGLAFEPGAPPRDIAGIPYQTSFTRKTRYGKANFGVFMIILPCPSDKGCILQCVHMARHAGCR